MNEAQNQLSTEVVGQFSPNQLTELNIIGTEIVRSLNYDPRDPDRIQEVKEILIDCIKRGLAQTGRQWFQAHESCAPTFHLGLAQREQIVKKLKEHATSIDSINYLSKSDTEHLRRLSETTTPFTVDLSDAESKIGHVEENQRNVMEFHTSLF